MSLSSDDFQPMTEEQTKNLMSLMFLKEEPALEEFLEMMGTVVFIYALTLYIAEHITKNRLVVQFMMSDDTDRYS